MKRILVCEDEDVIRDFVVINLKRAGYEVVDVNCGEEALRIFERIFTAPFAPTPSTFSKSRKSRLSLTEENPKIFIESSLCSSHV